MKTRIYNEELTTEIYIMMIHLVADYEKRLKLDIQFYKKGLIEQEELDQTKTRLALAKDLLRFFREARTTYLDEMPF